MTAQRPDVVRFKGTEYSIAGVAGTGLFDPADWGFQPVMLSTANWRGFVSYYAVRDGQLHLEELQLGVGDEGEDRVPPVIFGTPPQWEPGDYAAAYRFREAPISFSGGLLLGEGFIGELYVHMGFHPAWKFERVLELVFTDGRLDIANDHSEAMATLRREIVEGKRPDPDQDQDLSGWIERTFQLDYRRSFPD